MTARRTDESGMTLVELSVTLILLSVVGAMTLGFLWSVFTTTTGATADIQTEKGIQLAIRPLTENVRGASSISTTYPASATCPSGSYTSGYSNCLSLTIMRPVNGDLTCASSVMVYGLNGGVLREDRTDYQLVGGLCTATLSYTGRPLLKNVQNGSTPLFTYFDAFGNQLTPGTSPATAFSHAVTVRVALNVQYRAGAPLLTYTSDLAVRNNR